MYFDFHYAAFFLGFFPDSACFKTSILILGLAFLNFITVKTYL